MEDHTRQSNFQLVNFQNEKNPQTYVTLQITTNDRKRKDFKSAKAKRKSKTAR